MLSRLAVWWFSLFLEIALIALSSAQFVHGANGQTGEGLKFESAGQHQAVQRSATRRRRNKYDISSIGSRNIAQGLNLYSWDEERELGTKLAAIVEQETDLANDSVITNYVECLEQKIASHSDYHGPLTVKIVKDIDTNAYSLPGGLIYVEMGIILSAENEAEFAAVLAHETGHVAARHMTKLITKQKTWKIASLALGGPVGYLFARTGLPMMLMKTMRNSEFEADLLGLEYQYASGYDPSEFVHLLTIVNADDEPASFWDRLADSHPLIRTRISRAQSDIARYLPAGREYITDTNEFQEIRTRVANILGIKDFDRKFTDASKFAGESFQPLLKHPQLAVGEIVVRVP